MWWSLRNHARSNPDADAGTRLPLPHSSAVLGYAVHLLMQPLPCPSLSRTSVSTDARKETQDSRRAAQRRSGTAFGHMGETSVDTGFAAWLVTRLGHRAVAKQLRSSLQNRGARMAPRALCAE